MCIAYRLRMTYTLHYAPDNASLIIRLALEHAGLSYRAVLVDRAARAQSSPAYLRLNPAGLIPVLETPQGPLFETGAILLWLGDTHGVLGPGPTSDARGAYLKWLFFTSNTLHPALRMIFCPEKFIEDAHLGALRAGLALRIADALRLLDGMAGSKPDWLAGSGVSFYLAACLRWCALYPADHDRGWYRLADYPHLLELCEAVEALPATQAAQTAEGLGPSPFTAPQYATPPEGSAT